MKTLQDRLREAIERSGRSHRDVSLAAKLNPGMVNDILTNPDRSPNVRNLQKIAGVLGVSTAWLIEGDTKRDSVSEPAATPWDGAPRDGATTQQALMRALAPNTRQPAAYRLNLSLPDFGYIAGDVLIIDLKGKAQDGDIVIARMADLSTGESQTLVRRLFSPYLISARVDEPHPVVIADGSRTSVIGVVAAMVRAPQMTGINQ